MADIAVGELARSEGSIAKGAEDTRRATEQPDAAYAKRIRVVSQRRETFGRKSPAPAVFAR